MTQPQQTLNEIMEMLNRRYGSAGSKYWADLGYFREAIGDVVAIGVNAAPETKLAAIEFIMERHQDALEGED